MLFSSVVFLYAFLPLLLLLYFIVPTLPQKNTVLIAFSLLFYAWGEPVYVFLMIVCVLFNFFCGLSIDTAKSGGNPQKAKLFCILAVVCNLGVLGGFKYLPFVLDNINRLFSLSIPIPSVTMPVGISFFTFQALSYTLDVYRGDTESQKSFSRLLLYISLFPQLIAGPIVRYHDIDEQLSNRHSTLTAVGEGAFRFAVGLSKKVLLANPCGKVADSLLLTAPESLSVVGGWFGILFYAMQIYFDFSGYSDMAIGLGQIFGFSFVENFNYPYISKTATEFWRRWHISLGSFFRDYVYIPLGGNRSHAIRNVFVVWFLTGLWHGASWNFVLWGLYYGVLLFIEKKWLIKAVEKTAKPIRILFSVLYMIPVTLIGWTIFYYTDNLAVRLTHLFGIGGIDMYNIIDLSVIRGHILLLAVAIFCSFPIAKTAVVWVRKKLPTENPALHRLTETALTAVMLFVSTVMLVGSTYNPFLYFRF